MPEITKETLKNLDEKDKKILEMLQYDSRQSLTTLAKGVRLSIDATHKRLKRLKEDGIVYFRGLVNPSKIGFPVTADVYIKLQNITEEDYAKFINYLKNHSRVTTLLSVMGDYDIMCVLMTKDYPELEEISRKIRQTFSNLIADWKTLFVVKVHKFEEYTFFERKV